MAENQVALVAVEAAAYGFDKLFTYLIPGELLPKAVRGCRVIVPFGRANKRVQGLIFEVKTSDGRERLKSVLSVLDEQPIVTEEMFQIITFLQEHTFCTWYEAVRTVLPLGVNVDVRQAYSVCADLNTLDFSEFSPMEQTLLRLLRKSDHQTQVNALLDYASIPENKKIVLSLVEKGIVQQEDILKQRVREKTVRMLSLCDDVDYSGVQLTQKQRPVVEFLRQAGYASVKEVCYYCGITEAVTRGMLEKGYLTMYQKPVEIPPVKKWAVSSPKDIALSKAQQRVFDGILPLCSTGGAHGVIVRYYRKR